jgi:hypothetical protein
MQLPDHDSTFEATNKNRENIEQYQAFEMWREKQKFQKSRHFYKNRRVLHACVYCFMAKHCSRKHTT